MQVKAGFKKEWLQFTRTFRFLGILLALLSFALVDPLMYKGIAAMMSAMTNTAGAVTISAGESLDAVAGVFGSASTVFSMTMAELCSTSMLIIMLVLMSPCGGEQKKRATIIPSTAGLETSCYLIPKYVLYPSTVFVTTFIACCLAGGLCNMMFTTNKIDAGMLLLAALMCAIYTTFITVVYMSIGLCTSRPGLVTALMYVGVSLIQVILSALDLTQYHPLTLRSLISGGMFSDGFVLADNAASIAVGIALSVVIGAMMYVLTYAVQKGTKINNQENRPEF